MDEAQLQYFEAMEALFSSTGWKLLADDIAGWQEAIASQWTTLTPENLKFEQGRFAAFAQVVDHFKLCQGLKAHALAEENTVQESDE
jgi:hypothetical protein